jgi:predicted Zn-dependent peptidase
VIGSMEDLDAASLDDVAGFFRTYYAPNNAVLTLCGDFDPAEARRLVERWFGPIPRGPAIPPLPGRPLLEPFKLGREVRHVQRGGVPLPRVYLAWRIPVYGTPDYYAADVASELLAAGKSARLYRRLVRERRLARSVAAFLLPVVTGASAFIVRGNVPGGEDPAVLERALLDEVERLAAELPEPAEMERAITGLEARHLFELQKVNERADQISMLTTYFDAPELISTELDRYRAVTAEDVRRVVAAFLTPDNRVALTYVPDGDAPAEAS